MRFTITSQGTDRPLELDICGYHLEVSGIDTRNTCTNASFCCISEDMMRCNVCCLCSTVSAQS